MGKWVPSKQRWKVIFRLIFVKVILHKSCGGVVAHLGT